LHFGVFRIISTLLCAFSSYFLSARPLSEKLNKRVDGIKDACLSGHDPYRVVDSLTESAKQDCIHPGILDAVSLLSSLTLIELSDLVCGLFSQLTTSKIVVASYQVFIGILYPGKRDKCRHFLSS